MRLACYLLIIGAASAGTPEGNGIPLKASVIGHTLVLHDVYLNGSGPFRMMIDTGNSTSIVRREVAGRLRLQPAYSVEQVTASGSRRVPVAILDEVRAGSVSDRGVEAIIGDVSQGGVDGVLGQSWLIRHDYLLDYGNRRFALDSRPAESGVRIPLRSSDGRPTVVASINGRPIELVVDSGASAVVLYEKASAGEASTNELRTNIGSIAAQPCTVRFALAGARDRLLDAVRVGVHGAGPGLLPASAFNSVFVSNRNGFVQFKR